MQLYQTLDSYMLHIHSNITSTMLKTQRMVSAFHVAVVYVYVQEKV